MSALLVAFLISMGSSVWIFTKLQNRTGYGNSKNAVIAASIVFVIGFLVLFTIVHSLLKH